jgi:hypothetical protein
MKPATARAVGILTVLCVHARLSNNSFHIDAIEWRKQIKGNPLRTLAEQRPANRPGS